MQLQKEGNYYLKPNTCQGCPFYDKGKYFTPDTVINNASVYFLAQNPGEQEEKGLQLVQRTWDSKRNKYNDKYTQTQPGPLLGPTGYIFNTRFLPLTGLTRSQVSVGNAIRCRPGVSLGLEPNGLPVITKTMKLETSKADIVRALKHCQQAHFHPSVNTTLVVTMGRYPMFALTGIQKEDTEYGQKQGVMESWRGYGVDVDSFDNTTTVNTIVYHPLTTHKRVFFTMHIAALFRGETNARFWHATLLDFAKVKKILTKTWPMALPEWQVYPPEHWPRHSAFDTEYTPENTLIRWSLCDNNYKLYCVEEEHTPYGQIPITPNSVVLAQNWLADYNHFKAIIGPDLLRLVKLEDLMLADSTLYTGEPHNLNYIASKYGSFNRWKHLNEDNPQLYSALDAHQPLYMWVNHYIPEFKKDLPSWKLYKNPMMKMLYVIEKAERLGSPIDQGKVQEALQIYEKRIMSYQEEARAIVNDDNFNLGGRKYMEQIMYDSFILD